MKNKAKAAPMPCIGDVYEDKDTRSGVRRVRVVKLARTIKKAICENRERAQLDDRVVGARVDVRLPSNTLARDVLAIVRAGRDTTAAMILAARRGAR